MMSTTPIPPTEPEEHISTEDQTFAGLLAFAGFLIGSGAWLLHPSAGLILGGILLGVWSWLVLGEWPEQ